MVCGDCGRALPRDRHDLPCGACGATKPTLQVFVEDRISVTEELHGRGFAQSRSRWSWKFYIRPEFFRRDGVWHRVERHFVKANKDKPRGWYVEHITNAETGEPVQHVEHPLKDHKGHGSARVRPPSGS